MVKSLINSLIHDYDISIPKKIEQKLHNKYKNKIENAEYESMPTLVQIQNYLWIKIIRKINFFEYTQIY